MSVLPRLSYDIILHILEYLESEFNTLSRCALASWELNRAASHVLYYHVVLSPPFSPSLRLGSRGITSEPYAAMLVSASLPRNAPYVQSFEIGGYISPRPPPLNTVQDILLSSIQAFKNVQTVALLPQTYHEGLFDKVLPELRNCSSLTDLRVNSSCLGDIRAHLVTAFERLTRVTLCDPTRAILQLLPDWLERLSSSLKELHLKDNCGSITPGVLRSFIPHLQSIRSFTLGLSYSLTDEDVFLFLARLPELEAVQLRYYLQLCTPARIPALRCLRSFTVKHSRVYTHDHTNRLCKWIRVAISTSPIERLRVICDSDSEDEWISGANASFDNIIDHLVSKHALTLRVLDLRKSFIGVRALATLCQRCVHLEELSAAVGDSGLKTFMAHSHELKRLHTASFKVCNVRRRTFSVSDEEANEIMRNGASALRQLTVNGVKWEGSWISEGAGVKFVLRRLAVRTGRRLGLRD